MENEPKEIPKDVIERGNKALENMWMIVNDKSTPQRSLVIRSIMIFLFSRLNDGFSVFDELLKENGADDMNMILAIVTTTYQEFLVKHCAMMSNGDKEKALLIALEHLSVMVGACVNEIGPTIDKIDGMISRKKAVDEMIKGLQDMMNKKPKEKDGGTNA